MGKVLKDERILATKGNLEKYVTNPSAADISELKTIENVIGAEVTLDGNLFTYVCLPGAVSLQEDSGIVLNRTTYSRASNRLEKKFQEQDKLTRTGATPPVYKYACETTWEYIHLSQFKPEYQKQILRQVAKSDGLKEFEDDAQEKLNLVAKIRKEAE